MTLLDSTRRGFLRGLSLSAGGALLSPMLRRFQCEAESPDGLPQRFVFVMKSSGIIASKLDPAALQPKLADRTKFVNESLAGVELPATLAPLTPFRDRMTILQGLSGRMCRPGHSSWFGALGVYKTGGEHNSGVILRATVDAELARLFPGPFRQVGLALRGKVMGRESEGTLYPGITAIAPGRELPFQASPDVAYEQLFGSAVASSDRAKARYGLEADLLDFMVDDISRLERSLPASEREKMSHYLAAFDELRVRRKKLEKMGNALREHAPKFGPRFSSKEPIVRQQAHFDLIAASLIAGLTNVVTMRLDNISTTYTGLGLKQRNVHGIGHRETCDGKSPEEARDIIRLHHSKLLADLARQLDAIPEGDGTMLDRTLIVYMSDSGNEHHGKLDEWPYVLIGGCRLEKIRGRYIRYPSYGKAGHMTIGNWYTTLLNAHGNRIEHYGNHDLVLKKKGLARSGPLGELV